MIFPQYRGQETCTRCHKPVDKKKAVWLELSASTGVYHFGAIPEGEESQGGFAFGADCAEAVRKNPNDWEHIGLAVKNGAR